jgi:hypothetical protein
MILWIGHRKYCPPVDFERRGWLENNRTARTKELGDEKAIACGFDDSDSTIVCGFDNSTLYSLDSTPLCGFDGFDGAVVCSGC